MAEEKFTFSISEKQNVTVNGWEDLLRWLERERAQWTWLVPGDGNTDAHNWAASIQNQWNKMINRINAARGDGQPISNAREMLLPLTGNLLNSHEPDGVQVLEIRKSAGDVAGSFAYAFLKNGVSLTAARNREELLGAVLLVLPDMQEPAATAERLKRERANYRSSLGSAIDRLDSAIDQRNAEFESNLKKAKRLALRALRKRRDSWQKTQTTWQNQATEAVASIQSVENAYLEAMRLQAPVKYWADKAEAHEGKEFWAIARLTAFFPLALIALGMAFWSSATYLLEHANTPGSETPLALYIIITGGLAVLSSILFWIGRLLTKLYLSEHHLRNDAGERAIMTQTYLALTKESSATDADRNIILTAIFRNTTDGIVKDDGPGDITFHSLLSRIVTR